MQSVLKMTNISIEFPGVKALDSVDFTMKSGTTHALIGANGAGKSTLMKVLSGAYDHYTGDILLDSKKTNIRSPKDALVNGIQIVHQEVDTALIPYLTVGENIMLSSTVNDMGKKQFINWKELHKQATDILKTLNINVSSKKLVSELTLAEKQMVLIARTVSTDCKFLILDEPTAPLSYAETKELFRIVKELKDKNVGIVFISHRLPEIFEVCEEITIMRNGKLVTHELIKHTTQNKVVENMLGRELEEQFPKKASECGEVIYEVSNLHDADKLSNVSMSVRKGEIVGIAGLVGAGKTELCKALFGETKITSGEVKLHGKKLTLTSPYHAVKQGIALVPEERRKEGILVNESVVTNLTAANLGAFTRPFSFLNRKAEKQRAVEVIESLGVKTPSEEAIVKNLSGGNQQKIAIGKWLIADAEIYIFDEPTKGVDVGAKKDIFELICELASRGKAIIYASSELAEIIGITNRVYVLYDGRTVKELETSEATEADLLYYSTGGN
ncbi:simple sugar transport system ATP-binding protein [Metabacillus crassostreae]|uniref:sugar ABC transporter ATP-binding protein n=1 Tax=Metabacillus crassostreae TaxID=929098 RepID=UPI00195602F9|nr:sugar ABC transporter ATP-binding protein [Metabacillus crassostreae]MBM7604938.1 simple sugar transport system ATP-binding protein [Metabacillus crassostreae]